MLTVRVLTVPGAEPQGTCQHQGHALELLGMTSTLSWARVFTLRKA